MSIFKTNTIGNYPSNTFDLSHNVKLSCKDGLLYPICNLDVLPGDKLNISNQILCRLMPMLSPVMHEMDITVTHHFVPYAYYGLQVMKDFLHNRYPMMKRLYTLILLKLLC